MKDKPIEYYLTHQCFRHTLNDELSKVCPIQVRDGGVGAKTTVEIRLKSGRLEPVFCARTLKDAKLWILGFLAGHKMKNVDWR